MEQLQVLVTMPLRPGERERIEAVGPRVHILDAGELFRPAYARVWDPTKEAGRLELASPELDRMLQDCEIMLGWLLPRDLPRRAPRLKWVQLYSAGTDHLRGTDILESGITVTTVSGIHAVPIGEYVLMAMLMLARRAQRIFQQQERREWKRFGAGELFGQTVGIVGLGSIGAGVAQRARAFGMRVIATRRSCAAPQRDVEGADLLLPPAQLPALLQESDFVVVAVPLTADTQGLLGARELALMKPTAFLINIARGQCVDEAALAAALKEGRLAGAALDTFAGEPLPQDSPLWGLPNVIVTPHLAAGTHRLGERATALFCQNLRRYLDGAPLLNVVDPARGY